MLNFKTFFQIAKKHIGTCFIYVIIFLILMVVMTNINKGSSTSKFEAKSVKFTVIDEDDTVASHALTDYLATKHKYISFKGQDISKIQDNMYYEEISYVLTIPKGYEEELKNGNFKNLVTHSMRTDSAAGYFFNQDVDSYFRALSVYQASSESLDDSLSKAASVMEKVNANEVEMITFEKTNNGNSPSGYFFQYFAYILISVLLLSMSPILMTFHNRDLAARISCSYLKPRRKAAGIGLGAICYSILVWLIILIAGGFGGMYRYDPIETIALMTANSFVYLIVIVTMTLCIASFSLSEHALQLIANVIGLGSSFLCGVFVPQWMLAENVTRISRFFPAYWFIRNNNILAGFNGEAFNPDEYLLNLGVQLLFALAFMAIYFVMHVQKKVKAIA
ncbi:MAG: ABC transporter permease [Agathobacter sp.]|uniref:ABC transporter permease n=1 Tax=Agathobacter sp. TaxID=2021311 RepID=UPI0025827B5E|nr:ABC transporter permease [Agathobacter sp.]MCR5676986.1 ABC transporter permease [Agathobacter sp.]